MKQYEVIDENLLDAKNGIICHQVNCQGKMNSGVAKAIREKYPRVYSVLRICRPTQNRKNK